MPYDEAVYSAAELLHKAPRIVVLTGAGVSAASGIATFRGQNNGWWTGLVGMLAAMYFGTSLGWQWTPGLAWHMYFSRFYQPMRDADPNDAHRAIAALRKATVITQNCDSLHQEAGSQPVYEVHGTVARHRCIAHKEHGIVTGPLGLDARCPTCGGFLRPDVVLFGESVTGGDWAQAVAAVKRLYDGDVLLIVGTSGMVSSPSYLINEAIRAGAHIIECNLGERAFPALVKNSKVLDQQFLFVPGACEVTLPEIVRCMNN